MYQGELGSFCVSEWAIDLALLLKKCAQVVVSESPSFLPRRNMNIIFTLLR